MAELAFAGEPLTETSRADAPRPDGRPNYTIDAVLELKRTLDDHASLFCLMGADSWLTIGKWYRAAELLMACDFIVGARPGFDLGRSGGGIAGWHSCCKRTVGLPSDCLLWDCTDQGRRSHLYLLPDLAEDVSATEVRAALGDHMGTHTDPRRRSLPRVANYIRAHRLTAMINLNKQVTPIDRIIGWRYEGLARYHNRSEERRTFPMASTETRKMVLAAAAACEDKEGRGHEDSGAGPGGLGIHRFLPDHQRD